MKKIFKLTIASAMVLSLGACSEDEKDAKDGEKETGHVFTDEDKAYLKGAWCECMEENDDVRTCEKTLQGILDDMSEDYELNDEDKKKLFVKFGEWAREGC